jgi:class 3 adenylate cyclase
VAPETRYARSGDLSIAYQVVGEGPFDLVLAPGFVTNVELDWQIPSQAAFLQQLASFSRLIRFDRRGTGMSDPMVGAPTLETRMDDVRAVMDAAGSQRAALYAGSDSGPMALLFAATYPERCWALVLASTRSRWLWAPDYPSGEQPEERRREREIEFAGWGRLDYSMELARQLAPEVDEETTRAIATMLRQSATPGAVKRIHELNDEIDVRHVLPAIQAPTLVLNRAGGDSAVVGGSRYLAEHIPAARRVEFRGLGPAYTPGHEALPEIQNFLQVAWEERAWEEVAPDRVLTTVLFTDIVGSTARAAELGDARWRELLHAHHALIRRLLVRFRGRELDTAGDGFFASFDGPARAIRCACAIAESVSELGLQVRTGLHTGECELVDGKMAGIAVHTGARVASEAQPGEVLVSGTVRDLVAGSGLSFTDRGSRQLKDIPGEWHLYAVDRGSPNSRSAHSGQ